MLSRRSVIKRVSALGLLPLFGSVQAESETTSPPSTTDAEVTIWLEDYAKLLSGESTSKITSDTVYIDGTNIVVEKVNGHTITLPRENIARIEGDLSATSEPVSDLPW